MELVRVNVSLTDDAKVLRQLERNGCLKETPKGRAFVAQYDGHVFEFCPGKPITLDGSVARDLIRRELIVVGDDLKGPVMPVLAKVDSYTLGEAVPQVEVSKTACQWCGKECDEPGSLGQHILRFCPVLIEQKKKEDLDEGSEGVSAGAPGR